MTGAKGRSGGARDGAGRMQTRILLSRVHAEKLAVIIGSRRMLNPSITAEHVVQQWIDEAWVEIDAQYQENAAKVIEEL